MREIQREHGRIALVTNNGSVLVNHQAAQFSFTPTATIVPEMTQASGALSGLTVSNAESTVGSALQVIEGGALAANFEIRDVIAGKAQVKLDKLARELIQRTSDPTVDPTLGGGPGLFTDAGAVLDPVNELGLASRLTLNSQVDPSQLGVFWKLRDGIGAATAGPPANSAILASIADSLGANHNVNLPGVSEIASEIVSATGVSRNRFEALEAFSSAQVYGFQEQENRAGVDTDQEMQKLLAIEQSYAANAKMIEVIDQMMQSLLRI